MSARSTWVGAAARWVLKQGMVSLGLTVAGMVSFAVASFLITLPLGFVTVGASCWFLEWLTREELAR